MARGNRYNWIYDRLDKVTGGIKEFANKPGNYKKLSSGGFMDLVIESIGNNSISLAHYYEQNGDLVPDPDMEVKVHDHGMAEALTFQNSLLYQQVYSDDGLKYRPKLKDDLNRFLHFWLCNLEKQGFYK